MDERRLSDSIMDALEHALAQQEPEIATMISQALLLSLTRKTGGSEFQERRILEERVLKAMDRLSEMRP